MFLSDAWVSLSLSYATSQNTDSITKIADTISHTGELRSTGSQFQFPNNITFLTFKLKSLVRIGYRSQTNICSSE